MVENILIYSCVGNSKYHFCPLFAGSTTAVSSSSQNDILLQRTCIIRIRTTRTVIRASVNMYCLLQRKVSNLLHQIQWIQPSGWEWNKVSQSKWRLLCDIADKSMVSFPDGCSNLKVSTTITLSWRIYHHMFRRFKYRSRNSNNCHFSCFSMYFSATDRWRKPKGLDTICVSIWIKLIG